MEGNNIRLINIPNDPWVVTYLRDYVCSFYINAQTISTVLRLPNNEGKVSDRIMSLAKVFAFIYGMVNPSDHDCMIIFNKKHNIDENGLMIQDVSPANICVCTDKEYVEDNNYIYFKIIDADFYARMNKDIRDFIMNECGGIRFNGRKGVRTTIRATRTTVSLSAAVSMFYGINIATAKLYDSGIKFDEKLNIKYKDYSIDNIYK